MYLAAARQQLTALPFHSKTTIPDDGAISVSSKNQLINVQFSNGDYLYADVSNVFNSITLLYFNGPIGILTAPLEGTTSTDNSITIGLDSTNIYIENRTGVALDAVIRTETVVEELILTSIEKHTGSAAWNAGADSVQVIPANTTGEIFCTVKALTGTKMFGFSDYYGNASYTQIDFMARFVNNASTVDVYELTANKGNKYSSLSIDDVVSIHRDGSTGTVTYRVNDSIIYTSAKTHTGELHIDVSFLSLGSQGGVIEDIYIRIDSVDTSVTWQNLIATQVVT